MTKLHKVAANFAHCQPAASVLPIVMQPASANNTHTHTPAVTEFDQVNSEMRSLPLSALNFIQGQR